MQGTNGFAEIWTEAHHERGAYVWSLISGLFRRRAPKIAAPVGVMSAVRS